MLAHSVAIVNLHMITLHDPKSRVRVVFDTRASSKQNGTLWASSSKLNDARYAREMGEREYESRFMYFIKTASAYQMAFV